MEELSAAEVEDRADALPGSTPRVRDKFRELWLASQHAEDDY